MEQFLLPAYDGIFAPCCYLVVLIDETRVLQWLQLHRSISIEQKYVLKSITLQLFKMKYIPLYDKH